MDSDEVIKWAELQLTHDELDLLIKAFEYYISHEGEKVTDKDEIQGWLATYDYLRDSVEELDAPDASAKSMADEVDDRLALSGENLERAKREGIWP